MICFVKLSAEAWGLGSDERLEVGSEVTVTKRDGSTRTAVVGDLQAQRNNFHRFVYGTRQAKAQQSVPAAVVVGDLTEVMALFDRARQHKKYPSTGLELADGRVIKVNLAGEHARVPGSLTVCMGQDWIGRVHRDGRYEPVKNGHAMVCEVTTALKRFAADPATVAAEFGRKYKFCCFCDAPLDDDRSKAAGYGPICARNFGLPWGNNKAAKAARKPAGEPMIDTLIEADGKGATLPPDANRLPGYVNSLADLETFLANRNAARRVS